MYLWWCWFVLSWMLCWGWKVILFWCMWGVTIGWYCSIWWVIWNVWRCWNRFVLSGLGCLWLVMFSEGLVSMIVFGKSKSLLTVYLILGISWIFVMMLGWFIVGVFGWILDFVKEFRVCNWCFGGPRIVVMINVVRIKRMFYLICWGVLWIVFCVLFDWVISRF